MTAAAHQLAETIRAAEVLHAAFAAAEKSEHKRLNELSDRLTHVHPDAPEFRELVSSIALCETTVRYLPDCIARSGYRLQNLREAVAAVK